MRSVWKRLNRHERDRGVALISAVAVAAIGGMLIVVVIGTVLSGARDSGTDRARTSEVHTAEGAVDAAYAALETGTPCRLPATGTYSSGTAPKTTTVSATVTYFDATGTALPCASDVVTGTPATAVVTAVSTTAGEKAKRTIQSKVNLTPLTVDGAGAAIFSASGVTPTNNFALRSLDPTNEADLWVDSGNYSCSSSASVAGNVIVVNGSATLDNDCTVSQDLFVAQNFTVNSTPSNAATVRVGGSTIVRNNATIAGGSRFGTNVLIHGSLNTWGSAIVTGGSFRTGVALSELPSYTRHGLPEALYKPSDFAGFANTGDRAQAYRDWVVQNATAHGGAASANTRNASNPQCTIEGGTGGNGVGGALESPTVSTVFDIRNCSTLKWGPNIELKMRADLVLYVSAFTGTNSLTVSSADGLPHRLWIISPDPDNAQNGTAVCGTANGQTSGNIALAADSYFRQPIATFFYTPCTATISNTVEMYGQIYGKSVILQNGLHVAYVPIGIPGVDLENSTPTAGTGYRVDIIYKREIHSS